MAQQTLRQRLEILADAAKYDASCASSGTARGEQATLFANDLALVRERSGAD